MSASRIIAEIYTQADTSELERAEKILKKYNNELQKGGKLGADAYKSTLSTFDKLLLKQGQIKKSLINEKDTVKIRGYEKALEAVDKKLLSISSRKKPQIQGSSANNANANAALLGSLGGGISGAVGAIGGLIGGPLGGAAGQIVGEAAGAIANFGLESFKASANFQSLKASVETFAGAEAPQLIKEIEDFAIANPIANLEASVKSLSGLLAQGLSGEESIQVIKGLTEVTGGNVEQFERLSYQIAQIRTRGKLTGDNLKDLAQSGFAPLEFIAKRTGESLVQVQDRMSKGKVTYQEVLTALNDATTGLGRFAGRSEAIAKTSAGAIANLEDSVTTFKIAFGDLIASGGLTEFVKGLSEIVRASRTVIRVFSELPQSVKEGLGIVTSSIIDTLPVLGTAKKAFEGLRFLSSLINEEVQKTVIKPLKIEGGSLFPFGSKFIQDDAKDSLTSFIDSQKQAIEQGNLRIKELLEKQGGEELTIAEENELKRILQERKKYGQLSKEEDKYLKDSLKAQEKANEDRIKKEQETTEKLKQALLDRNAQLLNIQDKIALEQLGESEADISKKYGVELNAELRQIQDNKAKVQAEIEATTSAQQGAKAKLLATFDKEAELVRTLSNLKEKADVEKYNKERLAEIEKVNDSITKMERELNSELLGLLDENLQNERIISNAKKAAKDRDIQEDYDRLKLDIENTQASEQEKTDMLIRLDGARNGALQQSNREFQLERLRINDKYFEEGLANIQKAADDASKIEDLERRKKRVALDNEYASGLISQKEYFAKLSELGKQQEIEALTSELLGLKNVLDALNEGINSGVSDKNGIKQFLSKEEIEALKARKGEVQSEIDSLGVSITEKTAANAIELKNLNEQRIQDAKDYALQAAQSVAEGLKAIFEAQVSEIDNVLEVQRSRLENARALAEAGFTGLIQQEQDKIELLQQKREEAVRRQVIIDNVSRISSQVLAVANAIAGASNPPTPATPFLIAAAAASALATIGASIASAKGFATGTSYLQPTNSTQGKRTDDILIFANKGEGIIPTAQNNQFNRVTKSLISGDPKSLASALMSYPEIAKHLPKLNYDFEKPNKVAKIVAEKESSAKVIFDKLGEKFSDVKIVNENTSITFDERGISKRQTVREQKLRDIRNKI